MSLPYNLQDILAQATQDRIEQEESLRMEEADKLHNVGLPYIIRMIPAWRKWYMKKTQPHNYFRVTKIVLPGMEEYPQTWTHKFQVWAGSKTRKLVIDERITRDAYEFLRTQPDWEPEDGSPDFFRSQNPNL